MTIESETQPVPGAILSSPGRTRRKLSLRVQILQCVLVGALAYVSYFVISHFILQSVQVVGTSMTPTLRPTERYLLNRLIYLVRAPKANDIVVLRDPSDNGYAVKRIVAGAGDSVFMKAGHLYVNGRELREPYLAPGTPTYTNPYVNEQFVKCGTDQYFVLGDNRNNSADSRIYGPVPRQNILGVIIH